MVNEQAKGIRSGYRAAGLLLCVGFATIGFTRLEDRAIIGAPGSPANAMSAVAQAPDEGESYADAPDGFVAMGNTSRVPGNRIRRILRDRDVPVVASRQILAPGGANEALIAGGDPGAAAAINQVLAPIAATPTSLGSLAPPLAGSGTPIFASNVDPGGGGGGGTPGGGGGTPGGGGGDPGNGGGGTPVVPVSPVPEPATWGMLILGLFGVGAALRRRARKPANAGLPTC